MQRLECELQCLESSEAMLPSFSRPTQGAQLFRCDRERLSTGPPLDVSPVIGSDVGTKFTVPDWRPRRSQGRGRSQKVAGCGGTRNNDDILLAATDNKSSGARTIKRVGQQECCPERRRAGHAGTRRLRSQTKCRKEDEKCLCLEYGGHLNLANDVVLIAHGEGRPGG